MKYFLMFLILIFVLASTSLVVWEAKNKWFPEPIIIGHDSAQHHSSIIPEIHSDTSKAVKVTPKKPIRSVTPLGPTIVGKNINTGNNSGIVGDVTINPQEDYSLNDNRKRKLQNEIDALLATHGNNKKCPIGLLAHCQGFKTFELRREVYVFLTEEGYNVLSVSDGIIMNGQMDLIHPSYHYGRKVSDKKSVIDSLSGRISIGIKCLDPQ